MAPSVRKRNKISGKKNNNRCPISRKHAEILRSLCYLPKAERRALLRQVDRKLIECIIECSYNVLRGTVPLTDEQKSHLRKHATQLRQLVRRGEKIEKKNEKSYSEVAGSFYLPY